MKLLKAAGPGSRQGSLRKHRPGGQYFNLKRPSISENEGDRRKKKRKRGGKWRRKENTYGGSPIANPDTGNSIFNVASWRFATLRIKKRKKYNYVRAQGSRKV